MTTYPAIRAAALLLIALLYWTLASRLAGVAEPWDARVYWYGWYPGALLLSAIGGRVIGWRAGVIVIAAQAPVMWIGGAASGPLWPLGLAILTALALPAVVVAAIARRAL